jgi:predicted dehydrogenase
MAAHAGPMLEDESRHGSTVLGSRRQFIMSSSLALGAVALNSLPLFSAEPVNRSAGKLRAAIIGHTGKGDYGHGLDLIFNDRENIEVVAVADLVSSGRAKAAERCKALRQYDDYRMMLGIEKPDLVSIAPRWTDQHYPMALAALETGAHIYLEKPFTQTLAEADEVLARANKAGLKIAVAHQMRLAPNILHLKRAIEAGLIGNLAQMRAYGKQDQRAGGEDLLVLGIHLFDLMRFFAGDALWCAARVLQDGHEITRDDVHAAAENIGPIAGDEIEAQFAFAHGVAATFTSRAKLRSTVDHWGIELIGSKATARILADIFPTVYLLKSGKWEESGRTDHWQRLENDPTLNATPAERGVVAANRRAVDDWLEAIQKNREPICSGRAATQALEMVMAIYRASLSGLRVALPLEDRTHPLAKP